MMESERIGRQIKALRKQKGHTQGELASELFISQSYLRKIEQGMANPTVNMVEKITTFLEGLPERK